MKKRILVAAAGEDMESTYHVIRAIRIDKLVLITAAKDMEKAEDLKKELKKFGVEVQHVDVKDYSINEIFRIVKLINESEEGNDVIMNVASGDKLTSCVTLSAAFVNGMKALGVMGNDVVSFPIMRFSYYKTLSGQKLKIMEHLHDDKDCCASLDELSKRVKMSLPLISYHINGNQKVEGLEAMGLVDLAGKGKRISVQLSDLGKMLMAGYL
jgi:DNA-binding transcriptional ArsR family regulator